MAVMLAQASVFLAVSLIAIYVWHRRSRPILRDIPGPFLASFSTLWQIWHIIKGHGDEAVLALHRRHGHFVRISDREVSTSHPDSINAVLWPQHRKGDWYQALAVPDKHHQTPMSEQDPKRHRERSAVTAGAYSFSYLMKSEHIIDSCIALFKEQLVKLAARQEPIHLDYWMNYLAFDIIGELTFSSSFGFLHKGQDIDGSIKNIRFLMFYQALMGYMYWMHSLILATPLSDILGLKPMHHVFDTAKRAIDGRENKESLRNDMVSLWRENLKKRPGNMEEREILAVASMTTIAGSETMTGALESVVYFLLKNPEALAKLQEELDAASREGHLSEIVQYNEAKACKYLQAVIKETLRYFPPVPFGLPREAPSGGITIGEQHFPEGTIVSVSPLVIHKNEEIFGPDADSYRPERWLEPGAEQKFDKYLCAFGFGYNGCPGKQFAYAELSKVIALLIRDFDVEFVDKEKEWTYRNQFTVVQSDWPVRIKVRQPLTKA